MASEREVSAPSSVQKTWPQVVHSSSGFVCDNTEPQTTSHVSPVPDQKPWGIDTVNMSWSGL